MPFFNLVPHPDFPTGATSAVEVTMELVGRTALMRFEVPDPARIVWPALIPPSRSDELWRTTCFELFLMLDDDERYVEFNFSPSSCWAAYAFASHRENATDLAMRQPPAVHRLRSGVDVVCPLGDLPHGDLRMGLSAVIEEEGGRKSYWALAHPPGTPDFHHKACFAARLPAPAGP